MTGSNEILIQTGNIAAAAKFYEGTLGLSRFFYGPTLIGLDAGGFKLFIERGPALGPVFEFLVPDLRQARAALLEAGSRIEQEDSRVPRCYVRDPFGLLFNVIERPEIPR